MDGKVKHGCPSAASRACRGRKRGIKRGTMHPDIMRTNTQGSSVKSLSCLPLKHSPHQFPTTENDPPHNSSSLAGVPGHYSDCFEHPVDFWTPLSAERDPNHRHGLAHRRG